jgi:hypothetical protein
MMVPAGLAAKIVGKEGLMKARASAGQARLRRRQAKLDAKINRGKRTVKTLQKRLKTALGILGRRQKARKRMK